MSKNDPRAIIDEFGDLIIFGTTITGDKMAIRIPSNLDPSNPDVEIVPMDDVNTSDPLMTFHKGDKVTIDF